LPTTTPEKILIFSLVGSIDTLWPIKKQKHSISVGAVRRLNMDLMLNDASEEGAQLMRSASVGSNGGHYPTLYAQKIPLRKYE
jgi:hypothetical protein